MAKTIFSINFYGHDDPTVAGLPAYSTPAGRVLSATARNYKRNNTLHVVGANRLACLNNADKSLTVLDYNAALGEAASRALAIKIASDPLQTCHDDEFVFLVTGYSSGGVSAIHMARYLTGRGQSVFYVGLADAAFQRGESEYLIGQSGVTATYKKNYYQTKENDPANPEIHNAVAGFTNFNLDGQITDGGDFHVKAVTIGNQKMYEDVTWCIQNC